MKVKITTGGGMRGLINYQEKAGSEFIAGTQDNKKNFLRETAALRELRPDCKKHVLHISLSLTESEKLNKEKWAEVADAFLKKIGLDKNSHFVIKHNDTAHEHVHLAINMINTDGKRWNSQKSALRAQKACEEIEVEFNLTRTRTLEDFRKEEGKRRRQKKAIADRIRREREAKNEKTFLIAKPRRDETFDIFKKKPNHPTPRP